MSYISPFSADIGQHKKLHKQKFKSTQNLYFMPY